jgi:hypothetical protein
MVLLLYVHAEMHEALERSVEVLRLVCIHLGLAAL